MPTNMNMWGQGWGAFNPFRSRAIPSDIYKKYYPKYQSPYAADPTSMDSLGGLRTGTNEEWAKWNSIKAFYDNPMQSIMQGLGMNPSGGVGGGGGGTQPDPYAGMTHLWRDPTGMIHDFGDNPQTTTTPNGGGGVDMNQMMNIFQMLNMMNGNRGNRGNRGNGNRGNRGNDPYGRGTSTPGGYSTKPLVTQPDPPAPPPPPPPAYTAPPPGGGDPSYYYSQQ